MRNSIVYLKDIDIKEDTSKCKSQFLKNKGQYINKQYGDLFLKDIVVRKEPAFAMGVCDCKCGEKDIAVDISALISGKTKHCVNCGSLVSAMKRRKYASDEYIGKVYGHLKVESYYIGETKWNKGVVWHCKCLLCGNTRDFNASSLLRGTTVSCGCKGTERNNKYIDKSNIGKYYNDIIVLDTCKDASIDTGAIWICKCKFCGKPFKAPARHIVSGHTSSCGCLSESMGIVIIKNELDKLGIKYRQEVSFRDCVSMKGALLRFDIAIFNSNDEVQALIEYDGLQHYDASAQFGNIDERFENLANIQDNDNIKDDYAIEHCIPLLRIEYSRKAEPIKDALYKFIETYIKGEKSNG